MQNISVFLGKFKNFGLGDVLLKKAGQEAVKKILKIEIKVENFNVKNGELFVVAHPAIKSELFLKKKSLEEYLNTQLSKNARIS